MPEQKVDADSDDDLDATPKQMGIDDDSEPEPAPVRQRYLPSSMGASVLIPAGVEQLEVRVLWGDYTLNESGEGGKETWKRKSRQADLKLPLDGQAGKPREFTVPEGDSLKVAVIVRRVEVNVEGADLPDGLRTASVFLVNRRNSAPDIRKDEAFAFQTCLEIHAPKSFVPRPDLRGLRSEDWDERIADLQYRDVGEFAVGHNIATEAVVSDGACDLVRTTWIPQGQVERVAAALIDGVTLSMDELGRLADGNDARGKLQPMVQLYGEWIDGQDALIPSNPPRRNEIGKELLSRAHVAADRIDKGIALLDDPVCLTAFRLANKAMAAAARRRFGVMQGKPAESVEPKWRPFQLAFLLMNLGGISNPTHDDREVVDLLFFPTGGGKTEAYLGLAAFTLLLRRLRDPSVGSGGVAVLMRYTLRLLTLDQLVYSFTKTYPL